MTSLTFKIDDKEARNLRMEAKRAKLTLSELLRQKLRGPVPTPQRVAFMTCPLTGTTIFGSAPQFGPLSTTSVKELLGELP
jgi:hypothetical protein